MDGTTKQIIHLVQQILPERPHHLSLSSTDRYPVPSEPWPHNSRLQYTTYVSEADRGILLTRPYYEIQVDPDEDSIQTSKTVPNGRNIKSTAHIFTPSASLAATSSTKPTEAKKALSTMSLKDYQQHKQLKKLPVSPSASGVSGVVFNKKQGKSTDSNMVTTGGQRYLSKPDVNGDRKYNHSPPKSPIPPQSPNLLDSRKRSAELNENSNRPHKRSRSDESMSSNSPSASSRFDLRVSDPPSPLNLNGRKEDRSRPAANGQSNAKSRNSSMNHTTLSVSVQKTNGHRLDERDRSRTPDDHHLSKASLPPLLSPLHFSPDQGDHDGSSKQPRPPAVTPTKGPSRIEATSAGLKGQSSPFRIPPLLSPTLPAAVEKELSRLMRTPTRIETAQRDVQDKATSGSGKKPPRTVAEGISKEEPKERHKETLKDKAPTKEVVRDPPLKEPNTHAPLKRSCIVVLKYKKKNVKRVLRLLALPPMKGLPKHQDRSLSAEGTSPPGLPPTTKKRPAPMDSNASNDALQPLSSTSFKYPRTTAAEKSISSARTSAAPATPLKATPMARVTSNNSQVQTPGDSASYTPRSSERPPTSQGDAVSGITVSECRHRYDAYLRLGTKLKHDRDAIVKNWFPNGAVKAESSAGQASLQPMSPSEKKLVAALSLEMVMSYMIAFKSLNQGRYMERKVGDVAVWERLMPHLMELRSHARHFRLLESLALQLRAVCFEQMSAAFVGHDAESVATKLMTATKHRIDAWTEAHQCADLVNDGSMKTAVGPWLGVEDTVRVILPILRRWCDRENVTWEQELQLPKR